MTNFLKTIVRRNRREAGMFGLLLILVAITTIGTIESDIDALFGSKFLSLDNLKNVTRTIGIYGIFSMGVAVVIITAGIDLSVGSLIALLGVFFLYFVTPAITRPDSALARAFPELAWPIAVFIVLAIGTGLGFVHGLLVGKFKLQAFVVTLCGLLSYRGLARFFANDTTVNLGDATQDLGLLRTLGDGSLGDLFLGKDASSILHSVPMTFVYLIIIAIVLGIILHRSVLGRYLYAAGRNELAAKYSGINTGMVIASAYLIAGFCTAFASIPITIFGGGVQPATHAAFYELYAIAAAVLGGCSLRGGEGSILGVLIGTSILIVLRNMVNLLGYETSLSDAITGGVIFIGVLADLHGAKVLKRVFRRS